MDKDIFNHTMDNVVACRLKYFVVIIELNNNEYELILNHISNLPSRLKYYNSAYNENMYHKKTSARIVDVVGLNCINDIEDIYEKYRNGIETR